MLGTDREPGIMARALNDLFYEMDRTKEDMKYKVSMSYLEVRNVRNGKELSKFSMCYCTNVLLDLICLHLNFDSIMV